MSGRKDKQQPQQDLSALEDTYRIVGELSARGPVREYLANRVDGGGDALILVGEPPQGDAGNALTLYAADVNLLATLEHRNLIPIREGRWIGQDRFAVVTERCAAPTIATLIARGESWSYPRIATILHEVNGLLEWSRKQKVVHRRITPDTLHLEPDTDRVLASFVAQPLTRQGAPGPEGDARTIAELAWALITRGRDLPHGVDDSLGIVRPELPRRIIEATDALMHEVRVGETDPPRVADYIALVAMTDAIARGEMDAAELQATIHQEQLLEREAWAETERDLRAQMAEQERRISEEREEMARTLDEERTQMAQTLETERAEMARTLEEERAAMARTIDEERQRFDEARTALERQIADEREELATTLTREREQLASERAELEARVAGELSQLREDRARLEQEVAAERAAMAATIATERAMMAETLGEERSRMELTLSEESERMERTLAEENARLRMEREEAETALAQAREEFETAMRTQRAEFETAMRTQREEFDAQIARERDEFDRVIIEERNALDAEKEGFAVYHAAEREAIAAERRALEELYLAYEAEGAVAPHDDDDDDEGGLRPGGSARTERLVPGMARMFGDLAPVAVAAPQLEPEGDSTEPAETESGLTRRDARRSRRAAWGIPLAVLLLVSIITATAVGIGAGDDDETVAAESRQAATAAPQGRLATPSVPTVMDSAAGVIAPRDSVAAPAADPARDSDAAPASAAPSRSYFAPRAETPVTPRRSDAESTPRREAVRAPVRAYDTASGATQPPTGTGEQIPPPTTQPARDSFVLPRLVVPTTPPSTAPQGLPAGQRDTRVPRDTTGVIAPASLPPADRAA